MLLYLVCVASVVDDVFRVSVYYVGLKVVHARHRPRSGHDARARALTHICVSMGGAFDWKDIGDV